MLPNRFNFCGEDSDGKSVKLLKKKKKLVLLGIKLKLIQLLKDFEKGLKKKKD